MNPSLGGRGKAMLRAMNPPRSDIDTLLAHWRLWQEAQPLSERTISDRADTIRRLVAFTGESPLRISPDGIVAFLARPGLAPSSRSTYHASIRAYSKWLVKTRRRKDDPCHQTPSSKRKKATPRPIGDAQLAALMRVVNRRRTRMMILLAALAGLRVHEIAKIRGEDFDLDVGSLVVTGKGGKTALIALQDDLVREAAEWPRYGFWFPAYGARAGRPISSKSVSSAIGHAMTRAGFQGTPHQLRHWYGTTLLAEGGDLRVVQELMRHESPATTAIYTQVLLDQQRVAVRRLDLGEILKAAA